MTWKVAGINFDHSHMGDLLRLCHEHPDVEIVGICHTDKVRMASVIEKFNLPSERVFTDYRECLERTQPEIVILCPVHGQSCRMGAEGGAVRRACAIGKTVCRRPGFCRQDDCGDGEDAEAVHHQLAASLVSLPRDSQAPPEGRDNRRVD